MNPSSDYEQIKSIFSDPRINNLLTDDHTPEDYELPTHCIYLLSDSGDGVVMLVPRSSVEVEAHIAISPDSKHKAFYEGKKALDWIFEHFWKVSVNIPFTNEQVFRYCLKLGFQTEGINRMSFLKNGKLRDQWILGMTREDWVCHH